jgi:FemAB-related protein (PEP-CTERM system-associated)
LNVQRLGESGFGDEGLWDRFVRSSPDGTVFHLTAWKHVVEDVFRHRPHYLIAEDAGEIRAALPLFEVRGLLSGRALISVPCGVYGGLCGADPEARAALLDEARRLGSRTRARFVELRSLHSPAEDLPTKSLYKVFAKPLEADPEANLEAIPRKQRRMVRQGLKNDLATRRGWDALGEFYEIYLQNRRRLGSPPYSLRLFESIRDRFGDGAQLLTVWHGGRPISGVISLFHGDRVMPYYGAARPEAFRLAVNDFMYWELMRQSCLDGYRVFDFGRSREGSGGYDFKRHWGFEPAPLAYQYLLSEGGAIPNVNPSNPKLRLFIETWKRLPVAVTRRLGPPLTRWLALD